MRNLVDLGKNNYWQLLNVQADIIGTCAEEDEMKMFINKY